MAAALERVRGKVDFFDRLERVSSQTLLDLLEVPQRNRTAGTFRRLARAMAELGWSAVRVRDLTRGGYSNRSAGGAANHACKLAIEIACCRGRAVAAALRMLPPNRTWARRGKIDANDQSATLIGYSTAYAFCVNRLLPVC